MRFAFAIREIRGNDLLTLPADAVDALCGLVFQLEQMDKKSRLHELSLFDEPLMAAALQSSKEGPPPKDFSAQEASAQCRGMAGLVKQYGPGWERGPLWGRIPYPSSGLAAKLEDLAKQIDALPPAARIVSILEEG